MPPQQPEPVGPLARDFEQRPGAPFGLESLGDVRQEQLDLAFEHLLEHGAVERLLGPEVPVDDESRDAGGGRDLLHRGRRVAAVRECLRRRLEHGQPPGRAAARRGFGVGPRSSIVIRCNSSVYSCGREQLPADLVRNRAAGERRRRRAARRGRSALPRRVRRRRQLRVAPHETSRPRDQGVATVAPRVVRARDARSAARAVARGVPERRADEVPLARGCGRTDDQRAHAHRHGRRFRLVDPRRARRRHAGSLRREHRGHCDRASRKRSLRSARARRSGFRGRGRPQADVVRGARHRVRESRDRRHDAADARAHGHRRTAEANRRRRKRPAATRRRCAGSPTSTCRSR